ncbi:hypothetical protein Yalta_130 [Yalta virus]|nr:hypothetical protein Yalta_130 [Yalta virus]
MFDIIVFLIGFVFIVFFCIFLYNGGTIFDLITLANFNSIYKYIDKNISDALYNSNESISYNIAPTEIYVYKTNAEAIEFIPLLNQISVTQQDKITTILDVNKDIARLVPIFANLKREFIYPSFVI